MRLPRPAVVSVIAIPALTMIPYLLGAAWTPPGKVYLWMHALNTGDPYTYLSWIEQARRGALLFRVLHTEEPCRALLIHPLFLAVGLAARGLSLAPVALYHGARLVLGVALLAALYRFFGRRLRSTEAALFATLYAAVGSGLGWAFARDAATAITLPVDLWMPEAILFLSLLESPLNLAALLLTIAILDRLVPEEPAAARSAGGREAALLFALTILLGLTHPFEVVSIAATIAVAATIAIASRGWAGEGARLASAPRLVVLGAILRRSAPFLAASACVALYVGVILRSEPVFANWLDVVRSPSPRPASYLLAFAPQLLLAGLALPAALRARRPADLLPIAWTIATALLLYAPLAQQRRFIAGVQIPLTLLATRGLFATFPRLARSRARWVILGAFLLLSAATNVRVIAADLAFFRLGSYPLYLEREIVAGIGAFAADAPRDGLLLAAPEISHFVPALTGRRVAAGHYDLTVDPAGKAERLRTFFDPRGPGASKRALLRESGATHVFLSPYEAAFAGFDPAPLAGRAPLESLGPEGGGLGLSTVFRSGPVWLFAVDEGRSSAAREAER